MSYPVSQRMFGGRIRDPVPRLFEPCTANRSFFPFFLLCYLIKKVRYVVFALQKPLGSAVPAFQKPAGTPSNPAKHARTCTLQFAGGALHQELGAWAPRMRVCDISCKYRTRILSRTRKGLDISCRTTAYIATHIVRCANRLHGLGLKSESCQSRHHIRCIIKLPVQGSQKQGSIFQTHILLEPNMRTLITHFGYSGQSFLGSSQLAGKRGQKLQSA